MEFASVPQAYEEQPNSASAHHFYGGNDDFHQEDFTNNNNNNETASKTTPNNNNNKKRNRRSSPNNSKKDSNVLHEGAEIVKTSLRGYFKRAQQLLHVKRFHEALIVLSKGANLQPTDSAFVLLNVLRSDAYAGLLDFGSAIASLRSALLCSKYDSEQGSLRARLAFLLDTAGIASLQKNQPERAYELVNEAADLDGGSSLEILLHRCFCLIALQRLDDASNELAGLRFVAETVMNESVALECVVLSISLGIVQRRFEDAKHFLEMTLKRNDPSEETSSIGGFGGGGEKSSWADHPRIIELEKEFDTAFSNFIREAKANGDIQALSVGIRCFQNDPELYRARAEALVEKGLFAQGIQDYFKTIEKSSGKDEAAELAVARTLFSVAKQLIFAPENDESDARERENLTSAVTYLSESHKWNPEDVEVVVMRGDCLFQMREHEAALGDFQRAQKLSPDNAEIRQRISDLHNMWAAHLFEEKNYDAAEQEFTKAIEISPFEPRFFFLRAQCRLLSAKNPEDHMLGVRDLIECRKLGAQDPDIVIMMNQLCPDDRVADSSFMSGEEQREQLMLERAKREATVLHKNRAAIKHLYNPGTKRTRFLLSHNNKNDHNSKYHQSDEFTDETVVEVENLRGNRAELLSSPIDSKKLREATASLTNDHRNLLSSTFHHDNRNNSNNSDGDRGEKNTPTVIVQPQQKTLQELSGSRYTAKSQVAQNQDKQNKQQQLKEPFWLKKGEVTVLQMKNRLSKHEFDTTNSSKNNLNSMKTPQKQTLHQSSSSSSPAPLLSSSSSTTKKQSSRGKLLQQLLLEKEQQMQGQGQIQDQQESAAFLRSVHHPPAVARNQVVSFANDSNNAESLVKTNKKLLLGGVNDASAKDATKRRESVKYQQEQRVRMLPPISGVNVL